MRRFKSTRGIARPTLMTVGMLATALWAASSIASLIFHLLRNAEWKMSTPASLSFLIGTSFFAAIAYGIALERSWVRPLVPAFWFYGGIETLFFHQIAAESLQWFYLKLSITTGVGGLACWYFYAKPNVVKYYAALAERRSLWIEDRSTGA